jgi:hypothetical protein
VSAQGVVGYAQPDFSNLSGTATDAQIPNNITITLAATATALAANGGDCGAGQAPIGVDASGAAESCTDYMEEPASSGIVARTAANTSAARTFVAGSTNLAWTNGDGVAGNPSIDVGANVALYNAGDKTWGAGSAFTWTFDGGANTDPNVLFTSGTTPSITTNSVIIAPAGHRGNRLWLHQRPNYGIRFATAQSAWVGVAGGTRHRSASTSNGVLHRCRRRPRHIGRQQRRRDLTRCGATLPLRRGRHQRRTRRADDAGAERDHRHGSRGRGAMARHRPARHRRRRDGRSSSPSAASRRRRDRARDHRPREHGLGGTVADPAQNEVCFSARTASSGAAAR